MSLHITIKWLRLQIFSLIKHIHKENHICVIQQNCFIGFIGLVIFHKERHLRVVGISGTVQNFVEIDTYVKKHESLNHDREKSTEMGLISISVFIELKLNLVAKNVKFFDVGEEPHLYIKLLIINRKLKILVK